MRIAKFIADTLTFTRIPLSFVVIWVGLEQGVAGLASSIWLTILAWTSDILDGRLARWSHVDYKTWIGEHDLLADMTFAAGLLVYLLEAGLMAFWLSGLYFLTWALIFWRRGVTRALGSLFQALIYGCFIWVAVWQAPATGRWLVGWILVAVILTWRRFAGELVPGFLSGIGEVLSRSRR